MTSSQGSRSAPEESASALLDQVLRGERIMWAPPGAWSLGVFIVCLAFGATTLAFLGCGSVRPRDAAAADATPLLWALGIAQLLTLFAVILQLRLVFGHAEMRRWLIAYVRALLVILLALDVWMVVGHVRMSTWVALVGTASLFAAHAAIHTYAYQVVTAFFALKRRRRLEV